VIVVHHLNNSRSQRILWLLEETGTPYEVKRYQRDAQTMLAPPELKAVHPLGKSPVITDGEVTLAESGAIVEYLASRYGQHLVPKEGTPERLRHTYWMHFAEGSAMPPLLLKLIFDRIESGKGMPFFVRPIARAIAGRVKGAMVLPNLERQLTYMEGELAQRAWFAGDAFSAADIQMSFPLEAAAARGGLNEGRPKLWAFLKRIHERPAYQRALDKGGKYELMR
jgi:glutathione S-transferase